MTIDELARRSGVSSRNIRAYQTASLLDPPQRDGRAGRYTSAHLDRLRLIQRLRSQGFSLAGIATLLGWHAQGRTLDELLDLRSPATSASDGPWQQFDDVQLVPGADGFVLLPGPITATAGHTN